MKLISSWIITVTDFTTQNQSIAPRQLVPVCLWLMTPAALGELNFGTVFRHKPRKNSQPGRIWPSKKDFQGFPATQQLTTRSRTRSAEGGCCGPLPWHVCCAPRSLQDGPSPDGWESSEELLHHLGNITWLFHCLLSAFSSCDRPKSMLAPDTRPPKQRPSKCMELLQNKSGLLIHWFKANTPRGSKILCSLLHGHVPHTIQSQSKQSRLQPAREGPSQPAWSTVALQPALETAGLASPCRIRWKVSAGTRHKHKCF